VKLALEVFELVNRIGPIFSPCAPKRAQALLMRYGVLDDDGADALSMGERHAEADGSPIVLHEENILRYPELGRQLVHHAREIVERVFKAGR
jgi:hypothetical protein